jgi:hypothetical protein
VRGDDAHVAVGQCPAEFAEGSRPIVHRKDEFFSCRHTVDTLERSSDGHGWIRSTSK